MLVKFRKRHIFQSRCESTTSDSSNSQVFVFSWLVDDLSIEEALSDFASSEDEEAEDKDSDFDLDDVDNDSDYGQKKSRVSMSCNNSNIPLWPNPACYFINNTVGPILEDRLKETFLKPRVFSVFTFVSICAPFDLGTSFLGWWLCETWERNYIFLIFWNFSFTLFFLHDISTYLSPLSVFHLGMHTCRKRDPVI